MRIEEIESEAEAYAKARDTLQTLVAQIDDRVKAVKDEFRSKVRKALLDAGLHKHHLVSLIESYPDLFGKPRTRMAHGIRFGYRKQKGKVVCRDEEATIERIKHLLPADQAELLIRVRESLDKQVAADLSAADCQRLGITIEEDFDTVFVKAADADVDKMIEALFKDDELLEGRAA